MSKAMQICNMDKQGSNNNKQQRQSQQQQQQEQQQQQRSDPSSARAFAFLFPLRIALKCVLSLTAGSVFFISAHASQVL